MVLVLTHPGIPEATGWDVARAVKTHDPRLQVILLTGWGEQPAADTGEFASDHLVGRVLTKPSVLRDLLAAMAEVTRPPSEHRTGKPIEP